MKKFYTSLMALATVAMAFSSCSKEVDVQEDVQVSGKMKTITVKTDIETRTTLDADHANLVWSSGDQISIFNDVNQANSALTYAAGGDLTVQVPDETKEIYAHYPYYEGNTNGPKSVSVYINNKQTQVNPGVLAGKYYPMVAKGTVSADNKALISLYPVASALALNIYHTGLSGEETVKSVKVTPSGANTKFAGSQITDLTGDNIKYTEAAYSNPITVTLTNPLSLSKTKPTDNQKFSGQIYVCLAKQSYANVKFEIETSKGTYTITSSDTPFDCVSNDFVPVNINLKKAEFEETEPDYVTLPWEWTGSSSEGKDELVANNYGVSQYGLGSDYAPSNAPYRLKFDGVGDYILIKTNKAIGSVTLMTKTLGGASGATFKIQASSNGTDFNDIESFSTAKTANIEETFTTTSTFDASYRFVRIYMSVKGSNIGVGHIKVTSGVAEPTIDNISSFNAPAPGGEGFTVQVPLLNYSQAPTLNAVVDGTVVTAATISNITNTEATITYTLAPNYSGAGKSGLITLTDENNVSGKITVYQDADKFTVSNTEIELAATAGATKTLTVVSDYDWTVDDALIEGFTVTPMSGEGSSSAVTLTVTTTAANSTANDVELGAFAIKRAVDNKETETITVSQKSAKLAAPTLNISGDASAKTITVSWGKNNNAVKYTYYVLDGEMEYKVEETTTSDNTTTSFTINDITLDETYSIAVKAIGNNDPWIDSDEAVEEYTVSGGVTTYQHVFTAKPNTGSEITLSGVKWNIEATNLGSYNSQNYAGVQIGTSKTDGEIKLTSSSNWEFEGKSTITEVRLWLNLGGTSVTPTVTIGGQSAVSDGTTVVKNSGAGSDYTKATKVTFTPAANGNTGVVVIDVKSVKAGYICAIEIDCQ